MQYFKNLTETYVDEEAVIWEIAWLLGQVTALIGQGHEQELADYPVTGDGLLFLTIVKVLGEDATQRQLTRWMVRRYASITSMAQRLERKGLIKKKNLVKANGKTYIGIELTEKGDQVLRGATQEGLFVPKVLSCLSFEEKGQFRNLLFKIRTAAAREIGNYEEPPMPSPERPLVVSSEYIEANDDSDKI